MKSIFRFVMTILTTLMLCNIYNLQNKLMLMEDKILLRKRAIIETINDHLKNICQIEHSRHRSFTNFMVNVVSGLIDYSFLPKKPFLKIDKCIAVIMF